MPAFSFRSILCFAGVGQSMPEQSSEALDSPLDERSLPALVFRTPGVLLPDERGETPNLLLSGMPGSGKTQLALALIMERALRDKGTVFYAAPTRPLAQENWIRLRRLCRGMIPESDIILSTGDKAADDWKVYKGRAAICCTIFEKLLSMLMSDWTLKDRSPLIVVDEAHMFNLKERGVKLDTLLASLSQARARVVVLTVESGETLKLLSRILTRKDGLQDIPPLTLSGKCRALPLEHRLAFYGRTRTDEFLCEEARLHLFEKSSPLLPEEKNLSRMDETVRGLMDKARKLPLDEDAPFMPLDADCIRRYADSGRSLLVVHTNKKILLNVIPNLCRTREKLPPSRQPKAFLSDLERLEMQGVISQRHRRQLAEWAEKGIFLHSGDLHFDLRSAVEQVFREEDTRGCILLATTTMAYGVNLRIDVVLLTTLSYQVWEGGAVFMDGIDMHNIMGRAGRFPGSTGLAVLALPARRYASLNDDVVREKLLDCYRTRSTRVLSPNPVENACARDAEVQAMYLCALRTAALEQGDAESFVSALTVARRLMGTVHGMKAQSLPDKKSFQLHVGRMLDELCGLACKGIALAERRNAPSSEATYRITQAGCALLDSGSPLEDAEAMAEWLSLVCNYFREKSVRTGSPLIWMTALLACPSVQQLINGIYGRRVPRYDKENFFSALEENLHLPGASGEEITGLRRQFDTALGQLLAVLSRNDTPQEKGARRSRTRMTLLAVMAWAAGRSLDIVEERMWPAVKVGYPGAEGPFFSPRLSERFTWRALLLVRFFGGTELLSDEEAVCAAVLERRLRCGLPDRAIPYFNGGLSVSRSAANKGAQTAPPHELLILRPVSGGNDKQQKARRQLQSIVHNYCRNQICQLCSWTASHVGSCGDAGAIWEAANSVLRPSPDMSRALALLHELLPSKNWSEELNAPSSRGDFSFFCSCLLMAVLMKNGWCRPDEAVPETLEDVHALLIEKNIPWRETAALALLYIPSSRN